jgi:hypothetical protein
MNNAMTAQCQVVTALTMDISAIRAVLKTY